MLAHSAACPWPFAVVSGEVSGAQTGNRAELTAILWLAELTDGDVLASVDSSYVVRAVLQGASFSHSSHHDLWALFWAATRARRGDIMVKKVKSHCNAHDVAEGKIGMSDFFINGMADRMAGLAAANAALPQWLRLEVREKDHQVFLIRGRLASIAQAEAAARQVPHGHGNKPQAARMGGLGLRRRLLDLGAGSGHLVCIGKVTARCLACKARSRLRAAAAWAGQPCILHKAIAEGAHSSHRLRRHRGLLYCSACGSWARGRLVKLARPCLLSAPAKSAGAAVLRALAAGRLPQGLAAWPSVA